MAKQAVVKKEAESREVSNLTLNPYESYGAQASQKGIVGKLLKFSKGDWLAGEDNEEVEDGKTLVAVMDQLSVGWIKWSENRPEQQIMGLIAEAYQPPKRSTLGDDDQSQWEIDETSGKPRDPWQFSNNLIMKEVGAATGDEEKLYTFATSSRGGIGAIGELCKVFGKTMRERPDEYPIVTLGVDSYMHSNKQFGRIKVPTLEVTGWEPKVVAAPAKGGKKK